MNRKTIVSEFADAVSSACNSLWQLLAQSKLAKDSRRQMIEFVVRVSQYFEQKAR